MKLMFIIVIMSMLLLFISNILMMMSNFISKKMKNNYEKLSPFESGFNPQKMNRIWFSLRFFLITIIFIIFDIEIALLLPMILTLLISNYKNWMFTSLLFLMILILGLIYEWNDGTLNWI